MIGHEYVCVIEIESLADVSFFNASGVKVCVCQFDRLRA